MPTSIHFVDTDHTQQVRGGSQSERRRTFLIVTAPLFSAMRGQVLCWQLLTLTNSFSVGEEAAARGGLFVVKSYQQFYELFN